MYYFFAENCHKGGRRIFDHWEVREGLLWEGVLWTPKDSAPMEMTDSEKLILLMLSEIHQKLEIQGDIDPKFIASAIYDDHTWAIPFRYIGVFPSESGRELPPEVKEVIDILDMWTFIENGYASLTQQEKQKLAAALPSGGSDPKFSGFDGNNETEHMSAASFLINELKRFPHFSERALNCHYPSLSRHRSKLQSFEGIRKNLAGRNLNYSELEKILS